MSRDCYKASGSNLAGEGELLLFLQDPEMYICTCYSEETTL
jgi:hypothetical protein